MSENLEALVVEKMLRVPAPAGRAGKGEAAARQFDVVLMSAGFKCSGVLLAHLSGLDSAVVIDTPVRVLATVRRLAWDHVQHNAYFKDFPSDVPDTVEFWVGCLREAMLAPVAAEHLEGILAQTAAGPQIGMLNPLSLPSYGRYQHTYQELLASHDELVPAAGDRVTVLHLGASPPKRPVLRGSHGAAEDAATTHIGGSLRGHSTAKVALCDGLLVIVRLTSGHGQGPAAPGAWPCPWHERAFSRMQDADEVASCRLVAARRRSGSGAGPAWLTPPWRDARPGPVAGPRHGTAAGGSAA